MNPLRIATQALQWFLQFKRLQVSPVYSQFCFNGLYLKYFLHKILMKTRIAFSLQVKFMV